MKFTATRTILKSVSILSVLLLAATALPVHGQQPGNNGGKVFVWCWAENLAGNGPLTFYLNTSDGSAVMVDSHGRYSGTFTQTPTSVRIVIPERAVFDGEFYGSTMYGTARNGPKTWKWSVQLQIAQ
jgi:hypothetical protein